MYKLYRSQTAKIMWFFGTLFVASIFMMLWLVSCQWGCPEINEWSPSMLFRAATYLFGILSALILIDWATSFSKLDESE